MRSRVVPSILFLIEGTEFIYYIYVAASVDSQDLRLGLVVRHADSQRPRFAAKSAGADSWFPEFNGIELYARRRNLLGERQLRMSPGFKFSLDKYERQYKKSSILIK